MDGMKTPERWRRELGGGGCDAQLAGLYGRDEGALARQRARWGEAIARFTEHFPGPGGVAVFNAPGRVEIGGNHTDHQRGCVLAASVSLDMIAVARPAAGKAVRLRSAGNPELGLDLGDLAPRADERHGSGALIRGIASRFAASGRPVGGMDVFVASNVPIGSGLSSSAAFEVLVGNVINGLYANHSADPASLARYGQYAENRFFGKPCGLMDQLASSVGGILFIDFRDADAPALERVSVNLRDYGHALCVIDSGADHAGLSREYATIPEEMQAVAGHFGQPCLRLVDEDAFMADIPALRRSLGDRAVLRALHFFGENRRARLELDALKANDFEGFLELARESGASSSQYLQNAYVAADAGRQAMNIVLGFGEKLLARRGAIRIQGGGFAGAAQAFVPLDMLDSFIGSMEGILGGNSCHTLSFRPIGGFRLR